MSILLENLTKRYEGHPVVNNVSLEIVDGEFFVLLGSSGSGKTTILNLIAGLTGADHGRILLHGREVTYLPTQQRRVGYVFQNYALFQHMTVADNIEFGLSIRKVPKDERQRRRDEMLELVGLTGLGGRMPRQLSGGQQQRVALARALIHEPDVLLLDEPLGALDAKIRVELRRSLRHIQRKLGIASILVTHDQEEAFDLADRIGVMNFGRLLEVGTPEELYQHPQTEFVASFLGVANLLLGAASGGAVKVGPVPFPLSQAGQLNGSGSLNGERRVQVLFRPEDVALACAADELDCPRLGLGEVQESAFAGSFERLRLKLPPLEGVRPITPPVAFGSSSILVDVTRPPDQASRLPLSPGDRAWVGVRRIHTLAHPGLSFLVITDGSLRAQAALRVAGPLARMAHARVTLLGCGPQTPAFQGHLQEAKKQLAGGLAALDVLAVNQETQEAVLQTLEKQAYDLIVLGFAAHEQIPLAEAILGAGENHLLLVPGPQAAPTRALICVAGGEPGKDDVLFAGRLVRHLGADATLLSVLSSEASSDPRFRERIERFLNGGVQSLSVLGVPAQTRIRSGVVREEILGELKEGEHDLLVLGAPLADQRGEISLDGPVGALLHAVTDRCILIVRSHYPGHTTYPLSAEDRLRIMTEMVA
jgi:sulfate transport system ATP-binding protein